MGRALRRASHGERSRPYLGPQSGTSLCDDACHALVSATPVITAAAVEASPAETVTESAAPVDVSTATRVDLGLTGAEFVFAEHEFQFLAVVVVTNPFDEAASLPRSQVVMPDSITTELSGLTVDGGATTRETLVTLDIQLDEIGFDGDLAGAMNWFATSTMTVGPEVEPLVVSLDGTIGEQPMVAVNQLATAVIRDEGMTDPEGGDLVEFDFRQITVSPDQIPGAENRVYYDPRAEAGQRYIALDVTVSDFATTLGGSNVSGGDVRLILDGVTAEGILAPNEIAKDGNSFEATYLFYGPAEASSVEIHLYQARGDAKDAPTAIVVLDPAVLSGEITNPVLDVQQLSDDVRIP